MTQLPVSCIGVPVVGSEPVFVNLGVGTAVGEEQVLHKPLF